MNRRAFTLVEIMVGAAVSSILAVAIFALMNAGMILSAKNLSLNLTSNSLRGALDRVEHVVQQADAMPQLINSSGATVAAGPAPGVVFDRVVGSPFVVALTSGSVASTATSLTLTRSTNAVASPPPPSAGDIIRISTTANSLRPRIQSVVAGTTDAQLHQPFTVNLTAALGTTVTPTGGVSTAQLVRNVAFLVVTSNGNRELRYYHTFDTAASLNDVTKYTLITDQIGSAPEDATPFSFVQIENKSFVNVSLRVRANAYDKGIRGRQNDQFNTYNRTDIQIRPKTLP